ncbi:SWIM-type domain-containing protein [Trichonephila clavipes]|nr:SWIM-type domain-containing protein [Trichonephila clavipes]
MADLCFIRNESLSQGDLVKNRKLCEYDLIASKAKYHYNANFLNRLSSTEKKPRQVNQVSEAMAEIFNYIENHNDSQFTLKELRDVLTGYIPNDKTIITRLQQKYLTDIIITTKVKSFTIILFRDTQANILSKAWYDNKKRDPEEERLRIVEAAAAIIREDIRSFVVETKSYHPPSKMLIKENQEIPKSLLHFLQEVIMKNRKIKIAKSNTKCTSIHYAIMAALRERSFSSQKLLSLSVFLHRRYGSERLIDVLHDLQLHMARDDAVVLIVETAMEESEHLKTAVILGEDIDMLVILIEHIQSHQEEVFYKKVFARGILKLKYTSTLSKTCFNASRYERYLEEDCTFDPEILQNLETDILDDENKGNE